VIPLLKKRIELLGHEVIECRETVNLKVCQIDFMSVIKAYVKLFFKHRKIDYDIIVLPLWWGAIELPMLKIISRKPIMYFGQGSPYDELVNDRKKIKANSFTAKFFYKFEKMMCRWSDLITKETQVEIDYYTKEIGVSKDKFRVLLLSADESKFPVCEIKKPEKEFRVLYFGQFIPLHGVEIIIEAAKILAPHKDIKFRFSGDGQTRNEIIELAKKHGLDNVEFLGFVPHETLLEEIKQSDLCLGIFGESRKASIVVTNKVFQILCSQKPLITMDSDAVREISLKDNENCVLIPDRSAEKLAKSILDLK
jgi:glycosyltransferase involved in cell wall biosynthesis